MNVDAVQLMHFLGGEGGGGNSVSINENPDVVCKRHFAHDLPCHAMCVLVGDKNHIHVICCNILIKWQTIIHSNLSKFARFKHCYLRRAVDWPGLSGCFFVKILARSLPHSPTLTASASAFLLLLLLLCLPRLLHLLFVMQCKRSSSGRLLLPLALSFSARSNVFFLFFFQLFVFLFFLRSFFACVFTTRCVWWLSLLPTGTGIAFDAFGNFLQRLFRETGSN